MRSGELTERVRLQRRAPDGNGDALGDWADEATVAARIQPLKGSDPIMGQRLQGEQPVVIYLRASTLTRGVDNSWRAVNARSGQVYEVRSPLQAEDRASVQLLANAKTGVVVNG